MSSLPTQGALLHNLLLFGRVLHGLGLEVNPARMVNLQAAFAYVQVGHREDFYHTLRSFLVRRKEDLPLFDQVFDLFWRKPPEEAQDLDLNQFLGVPEGQPLAQETVVVPPQAAPEKATTDDLEPNDDEWLEVIELTQTYSTREALRHKDFAELTASELAAIKHMIAELVWQLGRRRTRRYVPGRNGLLDIRRSLRRNLHHGGELLEWSYRTPKIKPRPLLVIADISGSMEQYTRPLLHFVYSLKHGLRQRVEIFVFSTRLTCITRPLRHKHVDQALAEVAGTVHDWSGGTRIGDALKTFNYDWTRRVAHGGPVVLLISDGWDRGDPALLQREMARLQRRCHRLIWLNPLLGHQEYEPLTRGMQAALPHIDDFLPVHNLASLEDLARHLQRLTGNRLEWGPRLQTAGAAFVGGRKGLCRN